MVNEHDVKVFMSKFNGMMNLFIAAAATEVSLGNLYGVNQKVPLLFWESFSQSRGQVLMTKTPRGKVVFPGLMSSLFISPGVLYFLNLVHITGKSGKIYCHTTGSDWHTEAYWNELINGQKIAAIKTCRQATNLGLRESKDIVDQECVYVDYQMPNWNPPFQSQAVNNFSSNTPVARVACLEKEIESWKREYEMIKSRETQYRNDNSKLSSLVRELENELSDTIIKFADYAKINKPQTVNHKRKFNVWDIIGAKPDMPKGEIEYKIKAALKVYHPNKVFECGKLLQEMSNEITLVLLDLKKSLR